MIPKRSRLTSAEVREVLKEGRAARVGGVSVRFVAASVGRAAMVVSAKVAKTAVLRNILRRRGYRSLPRILPPYRMVFFIQKKDFNPADIPLLCLKLS